MPKLAETIANCKVSSGSLAIFWLCQAGFAFKTASGQLVYIDPYFSDLVERLVGFKRMMPCPLLVEEANPDLLICTHEHPDHMDTDALSALATNTRTHFVGPIECFKEFKKNKIPPERCHLLEEGHKFNLNGIVVAGVYADHGEYAPDALGIVLNLDGIGVYHTGDTAYRPVQFGPAVDMHPDIFIPCINGKFGNMDAHEAALATKLIAPQLVIPSHFWMFVEQNGDPGAFLEYCKEFAPRTRALLMSPGEEFIFEKRP